MNTRLSKKRCNRDISSSMFEDYKLEDADDEEDYDEDYDEDYLPEKEYNQMKNNPEYKKIRKKILEAEPNIKNIINSNFLIEDKVKLFQLYEIYLMSQSNTQEWLELRNKFNKIYKDSIGRYKQYKKYSAGEHKLMEQKINDYNMFDMEYDLKYKILRLNTTESNKKIIWSKYQDMCNISKDNEEYYKLQRWIFWAVDIPHNNVKTFPFTRDQLTKFLKYVRKRLDEELYGMEKVKEQLLLFLSSKILNPYMKKCSLGLVGNPGVGKTRISRLLAEVMEYPFEQISLGGVTSPEILKGHPYTYIGAQPGEIVKCMKRMKYKNGILFLDEYEKISNNSTICATLLHITDPSQNCEFRDNFLSDITVDLSHIWFIYSMNALPNDKALRDRIFDISIPDYTFSDKMFIVKKYLFPTALKNINKTPNSIIINAKTCEYLIKTVDPVDGGVRLLEKTVTNIVNKIDFLVNHGNMKTSFDYKIKLKYPVTLNINLLTNILN